MRPLPSQISMLRLAAQSPESSALETVATWRRTGLVDEATLLDAVTDAVAETQAFALGAIGGPSGDARLVAVPPVPVERVRFDGEGAYRRWLDIAGPLRLDGTPLCRAVVARIGDDHAVVLRAHHAMQDGYGLTLVFRRILQRYDAALAGHRLPRTRLGDLDEVASAAPSPRKPDLGFWSEAIAGVGAPGREISFTARTALPADRPLRHRVTVSIPGVRERATWPSETVGTVGAYTARHLGTPDALLGVVAALRRTAAERATPIQWMAVLPTRVSFGVETTPAQAGRQVRRWLSAASERVNAGERPEQLLATVPAAWRTGRIYGPIVNVLPYVGDSCWELDVAAWGPVQDCLINVVRNAGDTLTVDGAFQPDLYDEVQARAHVETIAHLLTSALKNPEEPFADVAARPVDPTRVAIPGGYAVPAEVESSLVAAGFEPDAVELLTQPRLTVVLHGVDGARLPDARAVLPPGIRVRLG